MSTIKCRKLSLDSLGLKTARLIYETLPAVKLMVNCWHDGVESDLYRKDHAQYLRRLVVRSLKELDWNEFHNSSEKVACCEKHALEESAIADTLSFGGTSSDDSADFEVVKFCQVISPATLIRVEDVISQCAACALETASTYVLRSVSGYYLGLCRSCWDMTSSI